MRRALEISRVRVASMVGCHSNTVYQIENGKDCSQDLQRKIAAALHCSLSDLLEPPSEQRLAEICADYLQAKADAYKEKAKGAA